MHPPRPQGMPADFLRREPMSRREYARRRGIAVKLRQVLNAAAVVATCAAAALAGSVI